MIDHFLCETREIEARQSGEHDADVIKLKKKSTGKQISLDRSEIIEIAEKLEDDQDKTAEAMERMGENQDE